MPRLSFSLLTLALLGLPVSLALAAPPEEIATRRAEARSRFDRGMVLLNARDDAGALAEFLRAEELVPERQTLLMIGVVYGALNRPVEALAALERVLAEAGSLSAEQLAVARDRRSEQARKVGYLRVMSNVPATLEIDGIAAGRTPVEQPIPVAVGTRVVAAASPGHVPLRREVSVAGGVTEEVRFELTPSEIRTAHLFLRTTLPDADVLIDGQRVGRTPLSGSISVPPGTRVVELRRPGYEPLRKELALGDGATAELHLQPRELPDREVARGRLTLEISEPEAELFVDGGTRGLYRTALRLPAGRHLLRVSRPGFLAVERMVEIAANAETRARVALAPTPERREAYVARARRIRRWGWITGAAGVGLGLAAGALLATNAGPLGDARSEERRVGQSFERGQPCYPQGGGDHIQCEDDRAAAEEKLKKRVARRDGGLVALGVGAAAIALGAALLLTGDDPGRYDSPVGGWVSAGTVGGGGLMWTGRF